LPQNKKEMTKNTYILSLNILLLHQNRRCFKAPYIYDAFTEDETRAARGKRGAFSGAWEYDI